MQVPDNYTYITRKLELPSGTQYYSGDKIPFSSHSLMTAKYPNGYVEYYISSDDDDEHIEQISPYKFVEEEHILNRSFSSGDSYNYLIHELRNN